MVMANTMNASTRCMVYPGVEGTVGTLPSADQDRSGQLAQRHALASVAVEIRRIEPAFERALERRPLAVDRSVPSGVAIAPLVNARLPEHSFVGQAEPLRRGARRRVQRVALPLVAAVSE